MYSDTFITNSLFRTILTFLNIFLFTQLYSLQNKFLKKKLYFLQFFKFLLFLTNYLEFERVIN